MPGFGWRWARGCGRGGELQLNGVPVIDRTSFSADEFAHLTYVAGERLAAEPGGDRPDRHAPGGPAGSPAGTLGALTHETDSPAVQITASVTGSRSINAMNALTGTNVLDVPLTGADAAIAGIVQGAGIFTGFVGRPPPDPACRPT